MLILKNHLQPPSWLSPPTFNFLACQPVCGLCWLHSLFGWLLQMLLKAPGLALFPTSNYWFSETLKWWFLDSSNHQNQLLYSKIMYFWASNQEILCACGCVWKNNGAGLGHLYYKNRFDLTDLQLSLSAATFPLQMHEMSVTVLSVCLLWAAKIQWGNRGKNHGKQKNMKRIFAS